MNKIIRTLQILTATMLVSNFGLANSSKNSSFNILCIGPKHMTRGHKTIIKEDGDKIAFQFRNNTASGPLEFAGKYGIDYALEASITLPKKWCKKDDFKPIKFTCEWHKGQSAELKFDTGQSLIISPQNESVKIELTQSSFEYWNERHDYYVFSIPVPKSNSQEFTQTLWYVPEIGEEPQNPDVAVPYIPYSEQYGGCMHWPVND